MELSDLSGAEAAMSERQVFHLDYGSYNRLIAGQSGRTDCAIVALLWLVYAI